MTKYRLVVGPRPWFAQRSRRCDNTLARLHKVYQLPLYTEMLLGSLTVVFRTTNVAIYNVLA